MEQGWQLHPPLDGAENRDAAACAHRSHSAYTALSRRSVPRSLSRGVAAGSDSANSTAAAPPAAGDAARFERHELGRNQQLGFTTRAAQWSEGVACADEH